MDDQNACINPKRGDESTYTASPFFQPCQGEAYTFPNDHSANSWAECQSLLKHLSFYSYHCRVCNRLLTQSSRSQLLRRYGLWPGRVDPLIRKERIVL